MLFQKTPVVTRPIGNAYLFGISKAFFDISDFSTHGENTSSDVAERMILAESSSGQNVFPLMSLTGFGMHGYSLYVIITFKL